MYLSWKKTLQNILLIVVCGLKSFQTLVAAAENSLLPILGNNEAIAPNQEFSLLNNPINTPKVLAGLGQKKRQPEIVQPLVQLVNRWLNNSGQIEVTLADSITETVPHLGGMTVLLPIWSTADQLLFLQGGAQFQYDNKEIGLGVGQRWFTAKAVYWWGYSLFYDQLYHSNHRRLGLGIEQHSGYRTLSLNAYLPLSRWQLVDNGNNRQRPAFGFDLRWQQQLFRYPECCWQVVGEHYFADQLAANVLQNKQPAKATVSIGIEYTPFSLLNLGYSYQLAKGRQGVHQFQLSLVYRLGVPLSQQLQSVRGLGESSDNYRLALVQREKSIKLQQVAINRKQQLPELLHTNSFDETEEQADDKPPNVQPISEQENPGGDQLQEISDSSQSAPAVSSEEIAADDAPSMPLPELSASVLKFPELVPGNSSPRGRIGGDQLQEISDGSQSAPAVSSEEIAADDAPSMLLSELSASVSKFPGLVPGNSPSKGRTGKKKPGYSKSFNVKAASYKAAPLLSSQEQRGVQEGNAKENSVPFQPPTADASLKVDRSSMDSFSTQATNPPDLLLELRDLEISQEERSVSSESESLESTPHDNILKIHDIASDTPFNGAKGEQKTDDFESLDASLEDKRLSTVTYSTQASIEVSKVQSRTRSSFDTPTFGNTSPKINVSLSSESLDSSNFDQGSPSSSAAGEKRIDPSEKSGMLPANALSFSHGVDLSLKHSKRVPKNRRSKEKRNVKSADFFLWRKKLKIKEAAVEVKRQAIKAAKDGRVNVQDGLEAERGALQNDWKTFDHYAEDQKQTRAQLAADKRDFQTQQEELETKDLAVKAKEQELNVIESEFQQKEARFAAAQWKFQSQCEEFKAKERAVEAKQHELSEKETNFQQKEAQFAADKRNFQTQQEELKAEKCVFVASQQQHYNDIEALKQTYNQQFATWQECNGQKLEAENSALQNNWKTFYYHAEDQKQTRAQLAADKRDFQTQQEELETKDLAVKAKEQELNVIESEFQQKEARFAAAQWKFQSQCEEFKAKERAVEAKQHELSEKETNFQQKEAQFAADKWNFQTQQEELKAEKLAVEVEKQRLSEEKTELQQGQAQFAADKRDFQTQQKKLKAYAKVVRQAPKTLRIQPEVDEGNIGENKGPSLPTVILNVSRETDNRKRVRDSDTFKDFQPAVKKKKLGDISLDSIGVEQSITKPPSNIQPEVDEGNIGEDEGPLLPAEKKNKLNEEENGSISEISHEPSASADTGNAIDIQAQQESHQPSEQGGDDQTQEQTVTGNAARSSHSSYDNPSFGMNLFGNEVRSNQNFEEESINGDHSSDELLAPIPNSILKTNSGILEEKSSDDQQQEQQGDISLDSIGVEQSITKPPSNIQPEVDEGNIGEDEGPLLPAGKKNKLNEEENGSISEISREPSVSTDTGNAIDIQAQQESHQPSEQGGDDQTQEQSAGTNSGENRASNQVMDEPATNSNKFILKINQLTQSEMTECVEGKGYQLGLQSIKKIFKQRDNSIFIRDEAHFKQVVSAQQGTKILKKIEIDYTY